MDAKIERVAAIKLMQDIADTLNLDPSGYGDKWVECEFSIQEVIENLIALKIDPLQNDLDRANARVEELEDKIHSLSNEISELRTSEIRYK